MWGRTFDSKEYPATVSRSYPHTIRNGANWLGTGQDGYTYDGKRYHLVNNGQDWALDNGDLERGHDWITRQGAVPASSDVEDALNDDVEPYEQPQPQVQAEPNANQYAYTKDQAVNNRIVDEDEDGFNRILNRANGWNIFRKSGMFRGRPIHDEKYADTNRRLRPKFEDAFDRFVNEADPLYAGSSTADQYIQRVGTRGYDDVTGGYNTANVNGYATNSNINKKMPIGNDAVRGSFKDAVQGFINRYGPGSNAGYTTSNGGSSYNQGGSGNIQNAPGYSRGSTTGGGYVSRRICVCIYMCVYVFVLTCISCCFHFIQEHLNT